MELTNKFNDYLSHYDLVLDVKHISLKNVLQTHLINEKNVKNDCKGTCNDIKKLQLHNDKHCVGFIYYCENLLRKTKTGSKLHSVSLRTNL